MRATPVIAPFTLTASLQVQQLSPGRGRCRPPRQPLAHSQIAVTMEIYSHVAPGMQQEGAGAWARYCTSNASPR
jgi:hypothetical protein